MPSRDGVPLAPAPALPGLCCVRVCAGAGSGGPCPGDLLCAAPTRRLAPGPLVFMPLYKRQRICRMVFLYVPFKRPSFGFLLLQAPALQPPSPPRGAARGGGRGSSLGLAFAVVTQNVRVAFLCCPVAPGPGGVWLHLAPLGVKGGGRAGALLRGGGVLSRTLPPLTPPRRWELFRLPAVAPPREPVQA